MTPQVQDDLDKVFKALGHITRRRILRLLAQNPRYPYELGKLLDLNRRVVLKHLDALQEAGLVEREPGESELGPDRVYYRLSVSFGLSTTILPNSFVVRMSHPHARGSIRIPSGFSIPDEDTDVRVVRQLLRDLDKVNRRLSELDDERMRFAALRGQIIQRVEGIMEECDWDQESCSKVRALLNPVRTEGADTTRSRTDPWIEAIQEAMEMFESLISTHLGDSSKKEEKDDILEIDIE